VAAEVCYWRDMTLLPHLLNLLTKAHVEAGLCLARVDTCGFDRKALAVVLRDCVAGLSNRRGGGVDQEKASSPDCRMFVTFAPHDCNGWGRGFSGRRA
jgi:hypothetical protein